MVFRGSVDKRSFYINRHFDCNSQGVVYLITSKKCEKQYVGDKIIYFRTRFNNQTSSLSRFGKGQRGICGEQLYSHFSLMDIPV